MGNVQCLEHARVQHTHCGPLKPGLRGDCQQCLYSAHHAGGSQVLLVGLSVYTEGMGDRGANPLRTRLLGQASHLRI